jgi:hypothetical protein
MKKLISYSLISLVCLTSCQKCKKKDKEKYTVTGTIYRNCNDVTSNTIYYIVFRPELKTSPIELKTDGSGNFSYEFEQYSTSSIAISNNTNYNNRFIGITLSDENKNVGIIRESASNQLVLKLKTNHVLTSLDTIKYVFQYGDFELPIHGPITKDTIIAYYNMSYNPNLYYDPPRDGDYKILWWNFGMTNSTNQTQVDYTIHGCASIADTAYIVVP